MQIKTQLPPQEIFHRREELGLGTSIDLLVNIIENNNDKGNRIDAIKYLGIMKDAACFDILENVLVSDDDVDMVDWTMDDPDNATHEPVPLLNVHASRFPNGITVIRPFAG